MFSPGAHGRKIASKHQGNNLVGHQGLFLVPHGQPLGVRNHGEGGSAVTVADDLNLSTCVHCVS